MLSLEQDVALNNLTTFKVSATAKNFIRLDSAEEVQSALPIIHQFSKRLILGGGSNILFVGDYSGLVIYPQFCGIELVTENEEWVLVSVGASQNWHQWVLRANQNGWYGLENLALIPGTVGASPVQNIGAYGVEVKQFIHLVECLDLDSGELHLFNNQQCEFSYRDSYFKRAGQGRFLVTRVEFKLSKKPQLNLTYQPLADFFKQQADVTAKQVIDQVCRIRREKLPDPTELANAGSFFKNPMVSKAQFAKLQQQYPNIVAYPAGEQVKLAAGWLIENAGYKGKVFGKIGIHKHQALVLVNYGESDGNQIKLLAEKIKNTVLMAYGVTLEPEVCIEGEA